MSASSLIAKDRELSLEAPVVMGILNRTTDSFFDKGSYFAFDAFLEKAAQLVAEGADILDVGGVKAGAGPEVTLPEELDRVVPAVRALSERFDVAISVDTWRSEVLAECLAAGAHMGNDISGFADPEYCVVAARAGAAVVATHIRLAPRVPDLNPEYENVSSDVGSFLRVRVERALRAGVVADSIVLDAGFDLGKTTPQSLELLHRTSDLVLLGYPVLISASRKGFLGETLALDVTERRDASLGAAVYGYVQGARIFRVHDVLGTRRSLDATAEVTRRVRAGG